MRRAAALALALLLLAGCGAGSAPVPAETAEAYALESFELAGFPAVSGGAVYDCAGGSGAAVWPEAGAPLDTPDGARATALAAGGGDGVWTLDRYWDADGAEHAALCLHKIGGGCESFEPDWPGEVTDMCCSGGALYALSPEYHVYTLVGLEADFGRSYVHPTEDYEGIGFNHFAGDEFLTYSIPLWIEQNRRGADCGFDSPEFTKLLEMAGSMTKAESFSPETLSVYIMTNHMELINTEKERGLELWPVGFPGGSYISPTAAMGIHAATEEPEAAWEFIRWCVAERENFMFTLNLPALEEKFYELLHPYEDLDPEKVVIREDGTWDYEGRHYETVFSWEPSITERQADMMLGLVKSLDTVIYCDAELVDLIREDAGAFLAGERSLGDTAALLGDRLGTYLAEKYG